jgi:hypothetical protein
MNTKLGTNIYPHIAGVCGQENCFFVMVLLTAKMPEFVISSIAFFALFPFYSIKAKACE